MRTRKLRTDDPAFARLTVAAVALEFGHHDLSMDMPHRGKKDMAFARQVAMYLLQTVFGMTATRTGELLSRDRSTVAHAVNIIEDSREDNVFNRKLVKVEDFLLNSSGLFGGPA